MGKIKIKKTDVWIDMTPMSDVMVLLLTFFMLSANFTKNEVVKVRLLRLVLRPWLRYLHRQCSTSLSTHRAAC